MTIESQNISHPPVQDSSIALPLAAVLFFALFVSVGMLSMDYDTAPAPGPAPATVAAN